MFFSSHAELHGQRWGAVERLPNCSIPSEGDDVGRGKEIEGISRGVARVIEYRIEGV